MNPNKSQSKSGANKLNGNSHAKPPTASFASRVSLKDVLVVAEAQVVVPQINKTYLQSIAATKGPPGEMEVRNYHHRLFVESNAELTARCEQLQVRVAAEGEGIARHLTELTHINNNTDRYRELSEPSVPWTRMARAQVAVLLLFSAVLLGVGWNTTAQVLMASGVPGFESPWRAYLFSVVPIGIAFCLKSLRHFIAQRQHQKYYAVAIWLGGLLFGLRWVMLFAATFPAMTQSASDIVSSLSSGQSAPNHGVGIEFIACSMLAESLLAAGCWLTVEAIFDRHQPSARLDNPAYEKTQADLDHWHHRQYEQQELHAKIEGKVTAIEQAKHRFVEESVGLFHLAQAAASHNQQLQGLFNS